MSQDNTENIEKNEIHEETVSENQDKLVNAADFLPLLGTDHIEIYVGNAKQAAHFYKTALENTTFELTDYSIPFFDFEVFLILPTAPVCVTVPHFLPFQYHYLQGIFLRSALHTTESQTPSAASLNSKHATALKQGH